MPSKFKVGDKVLCATLQGSNYEGLGLNAKLRSPRVGQIAKVLEMSLDDTYLHFEGFEYGESAACFVRATPWIIFKSRLTAYLRRFYASK